MGFIAKKKLPPGVTPQMALVLDTYEGGEFAYAYKEAPNKLWMRQALKNAGDPLILFLVDEMDGLGDNEDGEQRLVHVIEQVIEVLSAYRSKFMKVCSHCGAAAQHETVGGLLCSDCLAAAGDM